MARIWRRIKRWYRLRRVKIRILNIDEALELYLLLKDYSPDEKEAETAFDFISIIIDRASGTDSVGIALDMVTCNTLEDLEDLEPFEYMDILLRGLIENKFLTMKYFFESF